MLLNRLLKIAMPSFTKGLRFTLNWVCKRDQNLEGQICLTVALFLEGEE